ncbi:hypothetical protein PACTADRAFT_48994 [Pachysolen tannophilus NRRL Y-2460]|uniref:UNC-45/Cro1/She4 central domain-containing protein n=1 Tax=Pachysolen tannophilus NRRL Y-2460 TaxID=669874 RepID=A0A1E4TZT8_PACTA|nr:hypothetical protein PACTADRAFT_48994 [Pachysolen tannophilus NRRL Y-2460]
MPGETEFEKFINSFKTIAISDDGDKSYLKMAINNGEKSSILVDQLLLSKEGTKLLNVYQLLKIGTVATDYNSEFSKKLVIKLSGNNYCAETYLNLLFQLTSEKIESTTNIVYDYAIRLLLNQDQETCSKLLDKFAATLKLQFKFGIKDREKVNFYLFLIGSLITLPNTGSLFHQFIPYILRYFNDPFFHTNILLILIKLSELNGKLLQETLADYLDNLILIADTNEDALLLFNLLNYLFPILTDFAANFFITNARFIEFLNNEIADIIKDVSLKNIKNLASLKKLESILKLFSSSCINVQSRNFIAENYLKILIDGLILFNDGEFSKYQDLKLKILISLVILKNWNFIKLETLQDLKDKIGLIQLYENLMEAFEYDDTNDNNSNILELITLSIEGLAYISLKIDIKKKLRNNDLFFKFIMKYIKSFSNDKDAIDSSIVYGIFVILTNVTTYNVIRTQEQKSFKSLKDHANLNNVDSNNKEATEDDDEDISRFIKKLLTHKFLDNLKLERNSIGANNQLMKLIYNLCNDKTFRPIVVEQGGLKLILDYLINTSKNLEYEKTGNIKNFEDIKYLEFRIFAVRSLAKILINNDPNLLFKEISSLTPVPFLVELLKSSDNSHPFSEELTYLDTFEALLALTNLSSLENMNIKNLIIKISFDQNLQNLILDSNSSIAVSALELLSNLIISPILVEKFFNFESIDSKKNLKIMSNLMMSNDLKIQVATLNFFANVTQSYEFICLVILEFEKEFQIVHNLVDILNTESHEHDLVLRAVYILLNLVQSIASERTKLDGLKQVEGLKESLNKLIRHNDSDREVIEMSIEICKIIQ